MAKPTFGHTDWQAETEREGVHYIEIFDPEGEEYAVVVHRVIDGVPDSSLDGPWATEKMTNADNIVSALNGN